MNSTLGKSHRPPMHDTTNPPREAFPGGDLGRLYVRIEQLASVLQEKYGLTRAEAMRKVAALKRAFDKED